MARAGLVGEQDFAGLGSPGAATRHTMPAAVRNHVGTLLSSKGLDVLSAGSTC